MTDNLCQLDVQYMYCPEWLRFKELLKALPPDKQLEIKKALEDFLNELLPF